VTALQEDVSQAMTDNNLSKRFDLSSATANVRAYQARLLEMAQANMTFAFEFSQRLATIRSPCRVFHCYCRIHKQAGSPCPGSLRKRWLH